MVDKKSHIKQQIQELVEMSKNLQEPRDDDEQQKLNEILDDIKDLSDYIDKL